MISSSSANSLKCTGHFSNLQVEIVLSHCQVFKNYSHGSNEYSNRRQSPARPRRPGRSRVGVHHVHARRMCTHVYIRQNWVQLRWIVLKSAQASPSTSCTYAHLHGTYAAALINLPANASLLSRDTLRTVANTKYSTIQRQTAVTAYLKSK